MFAFSPANAVVQATAFQQQVGGLTATNADALLKAQAAFDEVQSRSVRPADPRNLQLTWRVVGRAARLDDQDPTANSAGNGGGSIGLANAVQSQPSTSVRASFCFDLLSAESAVTFV